MTDHLEREIKLPFVSAGDARRDIIAIGARPLRPRRLQRDSVLDSDDGALLRCRCLLRVREEDGRAVVTFKGAPLEATMKVREEIETVADDSETLLLLFARLGFNVRFVYEKFREEFSWNESIIAIDETPLGTYVEIEGRESVVADAVRALGRGPEHYIVESYRSLYVRDCEQRGVPVTNLLFDRG